MYTQVHHPVNSVLPGTPSPVCGVCNDETLGSNLGLIREKEASAQSPTSFLLWLVGNDAQSASLSP